MMTRPRAIRVAVASLAVGLLLGGLSASSAAQTQIQVLEFPGPFERDVDLGRTGFGPGDLHVEVSDLLDPVDESLLGRSVLKVTIVRLHQGGNDWTFILDCTARLPDGDITFYGGMRFSELIGETGGVFAVTGGTGVYADARGTVTIVPAEVAGEDGFMWTFDLVAA